jgi:small conductance mechanosensitive channel
VELEGQVGTVRDIRLFSTILRTADNRTVMLPNGGVLTSIITNYTSARTRRLEWPVSLNLNSDFEAAREVIMGVLAADKKINASPEPAVVLNLITSDSIDLLVRAWVATADYWDVYFRVSAAIYKNLTDKGFDMGTLTAIKVSRDDD